MPEPRPQRQAKLEAQARLGGAAQPAQKAKRVSPKQGGQKAATPAPANLGDEKQAGAAQENKLNFANRPRLNPPVVAAQAAVIEAVAPPKLVAPAAAAPARAAAAGLGGEAAPAEEGPDAHTPPNKVQKKLCVFVVRTIPSLTCS